MYTKKRLVIIIITVVLLITCTVGHFFKFDLELIFLPKSYVLFCMEDTLQDGWRDLQAFYNKPLSLTVTASDDEDEVFSLTAYNDKSKIVLSSDNLSGDYLGLKKHNNEVMKNNGKGAGKTGENKITDNNPNKKTEKSYGKTKQLRSLIEIYNKYARVERKGCKSFAVTGSKDRICNTVEYEVVLNKEIIEILPDYFKNYIADETVLKKLDLILKQLDSDILMHIYIDDSCKIRSVNVSFRYNGENTYMEIILNNAARIWDDITITCISGIHADTTISIKSAGNHNWKGDIFTDETNVIILSGAATTLQLRAVTNIDFNRQKDNISLDMKGDFFNLPVHLNTAGDLKFENGWNINTNTNLELKFVDYKTKLNFSEDKNYLKDVQSYQSLGSFYNKKKAAIIDSIFNRLR